MMKKVIIYNIILLVAIKASIENVPKKIRPKEQKKADIRIGVNNFFVLYTLIELEYQFK